MFNMDLTLAQRSHMYAYTNTHGSDLHLAFIGIFFNTKYFQVNAWLNTEHNVKQSKLYLRLPPSAINISSPPSCPIHLPTFLPKLPNIANYMDYVDQKIYVCTYEYTYSQT